MERGGGKLQRVTAVVGVDDGTFSESAFQRAVRVFPAESTVFHLVHVRPDPNEFRVGEFRVGELYHYAEYQEELEKGRAQRCLRVLDKFRALAVAAGVPHVIVELQGDPREELCLYCARIQADILVLGSRGAGPLQRLLLGSVSTYCAQNAPCGVLIDRMESAEDGQPGPRGSFGWTQEDSLEEEAEILITEAGS